MLTFKNIVITATIIGSLALTAGPKKPCCAKAPRSSHSHNTRLMKKLLRRLPVSPEQQTYEAVITAAIDTTVDSSVDTAIAVNSQKKPRENYFGKLFAQKTYLVLANETPDFFQQESYSSRSTPLMQE